MIDGKIIRYNCSWFFLRKKHFCFECKSTLVRKKREEVVNSQSKKAKNYDFDCVDSYLCGNIKFITFYFECSTCKKVYEISELKSLEKVHRMQVP